MLTQISSRHSFFSFLTVNVIFVSYLNDHAIALPFALSLSVCFFLCLCDSVSVCLSLSLCVCVCALTNWIETVIEVVAQNISSIVSLSLSFISLSNLLPSVRSWYLFIYSFFRIRWSVQLFFFPFALLLLIALHWNLCISAIAIELQFTKDLCERVYCLLQHLPIVRHQQQSPRKAASSSSMI